MRTIWMLCLLASACGGDSDGYRSPTTGHVTTGEARCGDGVCNGLETISSCPTDCWGSCPLGSEGCSCRNSACDGSLLCSLDVCVSAAACPVGSDHCPCTAGGGCDPDLECVSSANLCIDPGTCNIGSEGCPCTQGGTCDGDLECNQGICGADAVPPPPPFCTQGTRIDLGSANVELDGTIVHPWESPANAGTIQIRVEWAADQTWTLEAQLGQGICPHNGILLGQPTASSVSPLLSIVTAAEIGWSTFPASPPDPNPLTEIYAVHVTATDTDGWDDMVAYTLEVCLLP